MLSKLRKPAKILGKALAYAFKPHFSNSFKPYAQSRARMSGFVSTVFQNLGVLERNHPLSRESRLGRARLRDLVAHAWARTDWKKPFGTQAVLVLSITFLLISGGLAATSFVGSMALKVGTAEAQMFTAPNQGADLAMGYIMRAFGIDTQGHTVAAAAPGQGPDMLVGAFKTMMATYSTAMLVLGGFILLYIVVGMIAGTAHDGRLGGHGFNQVWAPLRLVMAVGLLIPIGAGGYNSGQYIVLKMAEWGSALASNMWVNFGTSLAGRGQVIATSYAPALSQVVAGTLKNEICMALANMDYALADVGGGAANNDQISVRTSTTNQATALTGLDNNTTYSYVNKDGEPICGKVVVPQVPAAPGGSSVLADRTSALQLTAYNNMVTAMRAPGGIIDTIVTNRDTYLPANGANMALTGNMSRDFAARFNRLVQTYQNDVDAGLAGMAGDEATAANDAMTAAVRDGGWAGAASWFNTIARLNAEYHDRVGSVPVASGPSPNINLTQAGNPSTTGIHAYRAATQFVNSFSTAASQQALPTAGAPAVTGGRPTYATTAGMRLDPSDLAGNTFTAALMFNPILEIMTGGTSPFWNKGGTMMAVSENNPLADLATTGDWLLTIAGGLVGLAISLFAVAGNQVAEFFGGNGGTIIGMIAVALAGMAFGAGITLKYLLPLIPFIKFMFGVIGWLLNILEGIIAMPLVAIAHLNTKEDGLMPGMARSGYNLALIIFLKPALLIIGFAIAMAMFIVGIGILNDLWGAAIAGWRGSSRGAIGPFGMLMYTIIYTAIAYSLANMSFQLIETFADRALAWIGGGAFPTVSGDERAVHAITGKAGDGFNSAFIASFGKYQGLDKSSTDNGPSRLPTGGGDSGGSNPSGWGRYMGGGDDGGGLGGGSGGGVPRLTGPGGGSSTRDTSSEDIYANRADNATFAGSGSGTPSSNPSSAREPDNFIPGNQRRSTGRSFSERYKNATDAEFTSKDSSSPDSMGAAAEARAAQEAKEAEAQDLNELRAADEATNEREGKNLDDEFGRDAPPEKPSREPDQDPPSRGRSR